MTPPLDKNRNRIAYLFGADTQSSVVRSGGKDVVNAGSTDLWRLRSATEGFARLHIPGNFDRVRIKPSLADVETVLNLVTDPELNPKVLNAAARFLRSFPGRVINRPDAVLATGRDKVARLLAGIEGLVVPTVARFKGRLSLAQVAIDRDGISFPAILRRPGTHNGDIVALVSRVEDLAAHLDPRWTYLLTSFIDGRGDDPLYHKIRVYWFGAAPLVRHLFASPGWNVHGPDRETVMAQNPRWMDAERSLIEQGLDGLPSPARAAIVDIRTRMPLDYFGIDFGLLPDGRALLFEANATMNFYPLSTDPRFAYAAGPVEAAARTLFDSMIATAARR